MYRAQEREDTEMISTKGRYAIRLMQDLAEQNSDKPVPLSETANRQQISKKYLEAIAKTLVSAKLLKATSGKGGGYKLYRMACGAFCKGEYTRKRHSSGIFCYKPEPCAAV